MASRKTVRIETWPATARGFRIGEDESGTLRIPVVDALQMGKAAGAGEPLPDFSGLELPIDR